jgi:hypothetical protein
MAGGRPGRLPGFSYSGAPQGVVPPASTGPTATSMMWTEISSVVSGADDDRGCRLKMFKARATTVTISVRTAAIEPIATHASEEIPMKLVAFAAVA